MLNAGGRLVDPVTLLVAAIVAGASESARSLVSEEVKNIYGALRSKVLSLFGRDPVVEISVDAVEANPESPKAAAALTQVLSERDITDPELVELAEKVRQAVDPKRIENALRLAADAVAENNRVEVTASPDYDGSIQNVMEVGERAQAKGNVVGVNITDSSDPPD
jgi:hypothetical protein